MRPLASLLVALVLGLLLAGAAFAAWPNQPGVNLKLCNAANDQYYPTIVSDGAGGAIVTWYDARSGTNDDIYAQHVLASGVVDPAWSANGTLLCNAANNQQYPTIVSDGAGGAIVTWYDARSGSPDIYAQRVLASGVVDPAWTANGTLLCNAANSQTDPTIVSDGAGGAIVTWYDARSGSPDIYAQHVLASGVVDPAWTANGTLLCDAANFQVTPTIVSDGAGGAIVTWYDLRSSTSYDIYAQHVLASGVVDPAWSANGTLLCNAANSQENPTIVSDGAGGAIVTWEDSRSGAYSDIWAQHVLASGVVDPAWSPNGTLLCTAANNQQYPTIVSDGAGGAIVTWYDARSGTNYDIYAQHVLASGVVDPAWTANGTLLCNAANQQVTPTIVSDGAGGAIVTWYDARSGIFYDIYAQHVLASGVVDPAWTANGTLLCTAANNQQYPTIVSDGAGGAIVTWQDLRGGNNDIYAQRVARFGFLGTPEAEIVSVNDVPNDQGGKVKLSWNASYLDVNSDPNLSAYDILRSAPPAAVAAARARGARLVPLGMGVPLPGELVVTRYGAQASYWEYLASVSALHYLSGYSYIAPTTGDSIGAGNPLTGFMVVARNTTDTKFWPSQPASGYSVDNLSPALPAPFAGSYSDGATHLHWNPSTEGDLAGYRLYRGNFAGFAPGPGNLVAAQPDTGYADVGPTGSFYKLSAVDTHGNESGFALLTPSQTTGVSGGDLVNFALEGVRPNPSTAHDLSVVFDLPSALPARLELVDVKGRRVVEHEVGSLGAGHHVVNFAADRRIPPGLYFVRLTQGSNARVARVAVLK